MKKLSQYLIESLNDSKVFVVLKPGSLDLAQIVISRFEESGWIMDRTTTKQLLPVEAKDNSFFRSMANHRQILPLSLQFLLSGDHRLLG